MMEKIYDNIQRVYDLAGCRGYKEVRRVVQKGIFKKRMVNVLDKVEESRGDVRTRITKDFLNTLEDVFHKKPCIDGVKEEDLPKILNSSMVTFLVSDGQGKKIASINYSLGVERSSYHGAYMDNGGGIALTVFGDAIETSEQFNTLQLRLRLPKNNSF